MKKTPVLVVLLTSLLMAACTSNPMAPNTSNEAPWMQEKSKAWDTLGVDTMNKMKRLAEEGKSEEALKLQKTIDIKKVRTYLQSSVEKLAETGATKSKQMKKEIYNLFDLYGVVIAFEFSELHQASEQDRLNWYKGNIELSEAIVQAAEKHLGKDEPTLLAFRDSIKKMKAASETMETQMAEEKTEEKGETKEVRKTVDENAENAAGKVN